MTVGPRGRVRAPSNNRSQFMSRARSDRPLPFACGRCGFESKVELTECEGNCGRSCCGRCTAEQLSAQGKIELLCLCCRAALSLGQAAPSAGSLGDMSTADGRVLMMRHKLQHVAMLRADGEDVKERSNSPLEPWALNVAMGTVRKGMRVVTIHTEPVPDKVVDELLNAEGLVVLTLAEHRINRFFGSQEGFEWSKADRSDEAFLRQHVQIASEPLGLVLKMLNGLEKYVALCYMMRMAAGPEFKVVVCGYGFDAADFAKELVRTKQAGAEIVFLLDQGQARSGSKECISTLGILNKGGIDVRLC